MTRGAIDVFPENTRIQEEALYRLPGRVPGGAVGGNRLDSGRAGASELAKEAYCASIQSNWLMEYIPMDKKVLGEFLRAGHVFAGELSRRKKPAYRWEPYAKISIKPLIQRKFICKDSVKELTQLICCRISSFA